MSAPVSSPRRLDGSMSLLLDMMHGAQDPAYAEAARVRAAGAKPRHRGGSLGAVLLVAVGLLTGVAAAAVRGAADQGAQARGELVAQVRERTADSDRMAGQVAALRADLTARRNAALASDSLGRTQAAQLQALELAAGTVAVTGDGLVATLDDRPATQSGTPSARGGSAGTGRVLDRDLQDLVNGLWAAGAEAVSINDLRLTARTAIRSAGEAILVDFRPLSPPYVVRAIGDPANLLPSFADSSSGRRLASYPSLYGLRFDLQSATKLQLPAGPAPDPRSAVPDPPATGSGAAR